jgi:murein DD-endopeptidase MepM/ murein hydrolase activator NlpD
VSQQIRFQAPPRPAFGHASRRLSPGMWRALIATLILVLFVASQRVPNPWRTAVRDHVAAALSPAHSWTGPAAASIGGRLLHWVEARSWGAVADLWVPVVHTVLPPRGWAFPVAGGRVTEPYGWTVNHGSDHWSSGITIKAAVGSPVVAVSGGHVLSARTGSAGGTVDLATGPHTVVQYVGIKDVRVSPGTAVKVGTVLGHLSGTHLLLAVMVRGYPVNPLLRQYLGPAPKR